MLTSAPDSIPDSFERLDAFVNLLVLVESSTKSASSLCVASILSCLPLTAVCNVSRSVCDAFPSIRFLSADASLSYDTAPSLILAFVTALLPILADVTAPSLILAVVTVKC